MNLDPNDNDNSPRQPAPKRTRFLSTIPSNNRQHNAINTQTNTSAPETHAESSSHEQTPAQTLYGEPNVRHSNTQRQLRRFFPNSLRTSMNIPLLRPSDVLPIPALPSFTAPNPSPTLSSSRYLTEDNGTDDEEAHGYNVSFPEGSRLLSEDSRFPDIPLSLTLYAHEDNYQDILDVLFTWTKDQRFDDILDLLQYLKRYQRYAETFSRLLQAEDSTGLTLLMAAVRNDEMRLTMFLLDAGADVNQHNAKRTYAILLAAQKGLTDMARYLVERGANEESKNMALIPASHFGHLKVVQFLLKSGAWPDYTNHKGTTPLMRAAQEGRLEVVEYLLMRGVHVCVSNNEGMTALMLASQRGHARIACKLIEAGSDVNQQTSQGSTALILASKRGHIAAVEALLTAGADIFLRDDRGKSAADTAQRRGHGDLIHILCVDNQIRLMRQGRRRERCYLLVRLSILYLAKRAYLKQNKHVPLLKDCRRYRELLVRTLKLPRPLLRNVALYIPDCFMWNRRLRYLHQEARLQPHRIVHEGIAMMDEIIASILNDFNISSSTTVSKCSGYLALLRDHPQFQRLLIEINHVPLTEELVSNLCNMANIQGALKSYPSSSALRFGVDVANNVVMILEELLRFEARRHALPASNPRPLS